MAEDPTDKSENHASNTSYSDTKAATFEELRKFDERLSRIENVLAQLVDSTAVQSKQVPSSSTDGSSLTTTPVKQPAVASDERTYFDVPNRSVEASRTVQAARRRTSTPAATVIMGLTAAAAFVLAAVYFIKLVYDAGWLTPGLQVGFAAVSGIMLIVAGTLFGQHNRSYAAYLPAVGVVVLYLAIYAGHLYYALFGAQFALGAVALTTLCAMWLARQFDNSIYSLFAVVGVYVTPILMEYLQASVFDLVIYYTAWSLLFSFASIHEGRRTPYILAMLFAIIGFDISFRLSGADQWTLAVLYQLAQFVIFSVTTYLFSSKHQSVLSGSEATVHGVGLFYFYGVQYFTLSQHVPHWVPWLALGSVVVVLSLYLVAAKRIASEEQLSGSAVLASSYASFVTAHVVYFELVPPQYFAWAALMAPLGASLASTLFKVREARMPLYFVAGAILLTGFVGAIAGRTFFNGVIPNAHILLFVYSVVLYAAFFWLRRDLYSSRIATLVLYAAHAALLVATLQAFENDILISVIWGAYAVALLLWAIKGDDSVVGKSSLLIFAASGLKVLLHDLDGSAPMTRVLVLIVLSISLYIGGWLYQKVSAVRDFTGNPEVDRQISKIALMVAEGLSSDRIALKLLNQNEVLHGSDEHWTRDKVDEIRRSFAL